MIYVNKDVLCGACNDDDVWKRSQRVTRCSPTPRSPGNGSVPPKSHRPHPTRSKNGDKKRADLALLLFAPLWTLSEWWYSGIWWFDQQTLINSTISDVSQVVVMFCIQIGMSYLHLWWTIYVLHTNSCWLQTRAHNFSFWSVTTATTRYCTRSILVVGYKWDWEEVNIEYGKWSWFWNEGTRMIIVVTRK